MICPKCKNKGVLNTALGKEFYYCRTCKNEITAEAPKPPEKPSRDGMDWLFQHSLTLPSNYSHTPRFKNVSTDDDDLFCCAETDCTCDKSSSDGVFAQLTFDFNAKDGKQ